jgi:hypothetical protein
MKRPRDFFVNACLALLMTCGLHAAASAQTAAPPAPASTKALPVRPASDARFWNYFDRETPKHPDWVWSLEHKEFGFFTRPENQLVVPDGFKAEAAK